MELGQKLRQARLEAGLSQRELCGDTITRNMLSQIENGVVSPSIATLRILAQRLDRPMGFFLDEEAMSAGREQLDRAWDAYRRGALSESAEELEQLDDRDGRHGRERSELETRLRLAMARKAVTEGRDLYARELLRFLPEALPVPELERERGLLQLELGCEAKGLPDLDAELTVRAKAALRRDPDYACRLLDACRLRSTPQWHLLRGRASLALGRWQEAAEHLTAAEEAYPRETAQPLEQCWRELGDYRRAYDYACRSRAFVP